MVLTKITTRNLQSHREVVMQFPKTGFIVFAGNNSCGKSIITKTTLSLLNGAINRPQKRAALVARGSTAGEIEYVREDGTKLLAHIQREAAATYVSLIPPNGEPIQRYISDRSYKQLLSIFGWHYDEETGISIQISEAEDALLFYKTSPKINGKVLQTATTDPKAEVVLANLQATIKEVKSYKDTYTKQITMLGSSLRSLTIEDVTPLKERVKVLERVKRNLEHFHYPILPEIKPVPNVSVPDLYKPKLPDIKYPRIFSVHNPVLPNFTTLAHELEELRNRRCPTCGKTLADCQEGV